MSLGAAKVNAKKHSNIGISLPDDSLMSIVWLNFAKEIRHGPMMRVFNSVDCTPNCWAFKCTRYMVQMASHPSYPPIRPENNDFLMTVYLWYRKSAQITTHSPHRQAKQPARERARRGFSESDRWGVCVFKLMDPVWVGMRCRCFCCCCWPRSLLIPASLLQYSCWF